MAGLGRGVRRFDFSSRVYVLRFVVLSRFIFLFIIVLGGFSDVVYTRVGLMRVIELVIFRIFVCWVGGLFL